MTGLGDQRVHSRLELSRFLAPEDPKHADGTPDESRAYEERGRQIAAEMFYLVSRVAG
ncbi:MAG: hypothetical protein ABMA64_28175 [Myxococcota bacterium]